MAKMIEMMAWCWLGAEPMSQATTTETSETLTHCDLYGDKAWVNIGSGNGLVPDSTKPLPEPILTNHQ